MFVHLPIQPFIHSSTHPSMYSSIHLSIYPSIHPSIHPPSTIHLEHFFCGWASKPLFPTVEVATGSGRDLPELTQQVGARTTSQPLPGSVPSVSFLKLPPPVGVQPPCPFSACKKLPPPPAGKGRHTPSGAPIPASSSLSKGEYCLAADRKIWGRRCLGERTGTHQLRSIRGPLKC